MDSQDGKSPCVQAWESGRRSLPSREALAVGVTVYCFSGAIVLAGILVGLTLLRGPDGDRAQRSDRLSVNKFLDIATRWDGAWYHRIATEGYRYDPERESSIAFYPLYPAICKGLCLLTGIDARAAALTVSHGFLFATIVLLFAYVRDRFPDASQRRAPFVLLAFALFPTTFYFRVGYSESVFVFLTVLALYGMAKQWRLILIAGIVGLATAARPVGIALALPLAIHVWRHSGGGWRGAGQALVLMPICCWGLLAFMLFQQLAFGEAFAVFRSHACWNRQPAIGLGEKVLALLAWEPVWSVYVPSMHAYEVHGVNGLPALVSLPFANPLFFVLAVCLVGIGVFDESLSLSEILTAVGLLFIAYFGRGYETNMTSQGRYVAAAFPIYLVLGNLLERAPLIVSTGILAVSALFLAIYSALFAAGYWLV